MFDELPELRQNELREKIREAAVRSNCSYMVEGVEIEYTLPRRFIEIDGNRVLDMNTNSGRRDSISAIWVNIKEGGKAPLGTDFLSGTKEGDWELFVPKRF